MVENTGYKKYRSVLEAQFNDKKKVLKKLEFTPRERVAVMLTMTGWSLGSLGLGMGAFCLNTDPLTNFHTYICLGLAGANAAIGYKFNIPYFERKKQIKTVENEINRLSQQIRWLK